MKNNFISLYNNEIISMVCIDAVLKSLKEISYSKALLIIPILTHNGLLEFLKKKKTNKRNIEELIIKKKEELANFNDRFDSMLELSIETIFLLEELKIVKLNEGIIYYQEKNGFDSKKIETKRVKDITLGASNLIEILSQTEEELFLHLRVII